MSRLEGSQGGTGGSEEDLWARFGKILESDVAGLRDIQDKESYFV